MSQRENVGADFDLRNEWMCCIIIIELKPEDDFQPVPVASLFTSALEISSSFPLTR